MYKHNKLWVGFSSFFNPVLSVNVQVSDMRLFGNPSIKLSTPHSPVNAGGVARMGSICVSEIYPHIVGASRALCADAWVRRLLEV